MRHTLDLEKSVVTYTRILVPLDGSKLAEQVLPYVRVMAKGLQTRIDLVRIVESAVARVADAHQPANLTEIHSDIRNHADNYLKALASSLKKDGLCVLRTVHQGDAASAILSEAETEPGTLIAMSTHGRSGISRWVLGSITGKVLQATTAPLLITRTQVEGSPNPEVNLSTVIAPLDGSPLAEQVLPHVVALARALSLKVRLVRVTSSPGEFYHYEMYPSYCYGDHFATVDAVAGEYLEQISECLRQKGVASVEEELLHGHPAVAIVDLVRQTPDSLVAMTTHGRSGVGRWLLGSVADQVVRYAESPVLIIRAAEEGSRET